jgi:hypothetical protein
MRPQPSARALHETEETIPMTHPDALDMALEQLAQSFADLSVVANAIRQSRPNTTHLRPALADELRDL